MMPDNYNQNQVQFEGERNMLYARFVPSSKVPTLVQFVMKLGLDQKSANYVLIGVVVLLFIVAIFAFASLGSGKPPSRAEIERIPLPGSELPMYK